VTEELRGTPRNPEEPLSVVRNLLREAADPADAEGALRYFKTAPGEYGHGDRFLGVRAPALRRISKECDGLTLGDLGKLLDSEWHEERSLALLAMVRRYGRHADEREALYALYFEKLGRINNWDLVDVSAADIVGAHLRERSRAPLRKLARSESVWERRIAIIATHHFIRRGEFEETLRIAGLLLRDRHDLIHKAAGWMLREVGERDGAAEEVFLDRHAAEMPRTMLRYAIEKFSEPERRKYMQMKR
jgi:3-methyladenine DNA glycosylase AlkD